MRHIASVDDSTIRDGIRWSPNVSLFLTFFSEKKFTFQTAETMNRRRRRLA